MNFPALPRVEPPVLPMKLFALAALGTAVFSLHAVADDVTRNAQTELKKQGFYYGEADGSLSAETSAAIKRYQIRNGLEVTGTLTQGTLSALGLAPASPAPAAPSTAPRVSESDRQFLQRSTPSPRVQPAPAPDVAPESEPPIRVTPVPPVAPPPDAGLAGIFARTPFSNAPREVQTSTLRKAQSFLAREGYFREPIDGVATPALEEALLSYQRRARLPLTGRLDLETLSAMRLLPGRGGPPLQPFNADSGRRVLRGIWVE